MSNPIVKLMWKITGRKELEIDTEVCIKCGKCAKVCRHNAVEKTEAGGYAIQTEHCVRCFHCKKNCPKEAIREKSENI